MTQVPNQRLPVHSRSLFRKRMEAFAANPKLQVEGAGDQRTVTIKQADADVATGAPLVDNMLYLDMDGDQTEEAVIPLSSGGTASNAEFLVYRHGQPTFVAQQRGYQQRLSVAEGRLVATDALSNGWEPNCCPSGKRIRTHQPQGDQLQGVAERRECGDARRHGAAFLQLAQQPRL